MLAGNVGLESCIPQEGHWLGERLSVCRLVITGPQAMAAMGTVVSPAFSGFRLKDQ
jgi:hypothetical protein